MEGKKILQVDTGSENSYQLREKWLEVLPLEDKDAKLFELEMLLRGMDRFFNVRNLPIADLENVVLRNFHNEMKVVVMGIDRCILLLKSLLPPEDANVFNFQMYLENSLLIDYARDKFILNNLRQTHPRESLYLMLLAFINFSVILKALLNLKHISYMAFHHTGQIVSREIAINRFFNPMEMPAFSPRYDKITIPELKKAVARIKNSKVRSTYSIIILALLRSLRYLEHVNPDVNSKDHLRFYTLIFSLLRSEIESLVKFIEGEGARRIKEAGISEDERTEHLERFDSVAFQIDIESKKVYRQVLRDILEVSSLNRLRSMVESAKGILRNILEQSVVLLAHGLDENIDGRVIFPDFIPRFEQSVRLREDIFIFIKILEAVERSLDGAKDAEIPRRRILSVINDYISYFMNLSFNYVRYSDSEEFIDFFNYVSSLKKSDLEEKRKFNEFRFKVHVFKTFLETTLGLINNRAELSGVPIDQEHAMEIYRQFL